MHRGDGDDTAAGLTAERDRLQKEIDALLDLVASGVGSGTVAAKVKERETAIAKLDRELREPRQAAPNIAKLREALEQRAKDWRQELRSTPDVARLVLRRLVGPLTLTDPDDHKAFIEWEASLIGTGLLEGLAPVHLLASPPGFEPGFQP